MKRKDKPKALCLLSGGLDSRLACKIMQEQCNVEGVYFDLPFGSGCCKQSCAFNFTQMEGVKLHIIDCTKGILLKKYIEIIRKPKHGYGSAFNPCIDCHTFMLKEAKKLAKKINADMLVTGEVLDERPMSQHRRALEIVEEESGLKGILLRPLSAKLLPETIPEKKGLIEREKLLDISGRRRLRQIELAEKFKIKYPSPGGGCLLCEKEFSIKLRDLLKNEKQVFPADIELLKLGRHFRVQEIKIVVGRDKEENEMITKLAGKKDLLLEPKDIVGPTTIIRGKGSVNEEITKKAAELTARYSDSVEEVVKMNVMIGNRIHHELRVNKASQKEIDKSRLNTI